MPCWLLFPVAALLKSLVASEVQQFDIRPRLAIVTVFSSQLVTCILSCALHTSSHARYSLVSVANAQSPLLSIRHAGSLLLGYVYTSWWRWTCNILMLPCRINAIMRLKHCSLKPLYRPQPLASHHVAFYLNIKLDGLILRQQHLGDGPNFRVLPQVAQWILTFYVMCSCFTRCCI